MDQPGTPTQNFREAWGVDPNGIYVPPAAGEAAVFVWHGAFQRGETITLLAPKESKLKYEVGTLYAGIVTKDTIEAAADQGLDELDAHIEAAIMHTERGLIGAVEALKTLGALPLKHQMAR